MLQEVNLGLLWIFFPEAINKNNYKKYILLYKHIQAFQKLKEGLKKSFSNKLNNPDYQ